MKKKIITGAIALAMVLSVFMPNINNANAANYNEAEVLYEDEEVDISKMDESLDIMISVGGTKSFKGYTNTSGFTDSSGSKYYSIETRKTFYLRMNPSSKDYNFTSSDASVLTATPDNGYSYDCILKTGNTKTIVGLTVSSKTNPDISRQYIFRIGGKGSLLLKNCTFEIDNSTGYFNDLASLDNDKYDEISNLITVKYNGFKIYDGIDYSISGISNDGKTLTVSFSGLNIFVNSNYTYKMALNNQSSGDNGENGNTGDSGDNSGDNNQNDNGGSGNESGNNSQDNGNGDSSDSGNSDNGNNNSGTDTGSNSNSDTGNNNNSSNNNNTNNNNSSNNDSNTNNNNSSNNDGNTNNNNSSSDNQNTGSNVLPWSNVNPSENGNGGNTSDNGVNNSDNNGNSNGGSDNVATDTKDIIGFYLDTSGDIRCNDLDGTPVINKFMCDGTYTYYFQLDGTAMKDRLTYHPDGVHVIYFDSEGHEVFSDFANVKKTIAGDAVDDFCFFDVFGYMYVDALTYDKTGSVLYYANPYGVMEMGKWFQFSDTVEWADGTPAEGIAGGYGYANADGTLMTNTQTVDWEGRSCYLQGNGVAAY